MNYKTITVDLRHPIAEIRLNRAANGNTIDALVLDELDRAASTISDDRAVHVVLLTADGDDFSRGGGAAQQAFDPSQAPGLRCLEEMGQPVIACIQGEAAAEGLELALACDLRIAAVGALFSMPQVANGSTPSLGGTVRLPRIVGRSIASAMILLGQTLDAAEALRYGLVNAVVPAADLRTRAEEMAAAIAAQGPLAVRYAKEAMREGTDMPLSQALRFETDLTIILQTTADRAEGVRAFLDKRPPKFTGS